MQPVLPSRFTSPHLAYHLRPDESLFGAKAARFELRAGDVFVTPMDKTSLEPWQRPSPFDGGAFSWCDDAGSCGKTLAFWHNILRASKDAALTEAGGVGVTKASLVSLRGSAAGSPGCEWSSTEAEQWSQHGTAYQLKCQMLREALTLGAP